MGGRGKRKTRRKFPQRDFARELLWRRRTFVSHCILRDAQFSDVFLCASIIIFFLYISIRSFSGLWLILDSRFYVIYKLIYVVIIIFHILIHLKGLIRISFVSFSICQKIVIQDLKNVDTFYLIKYWYLRVCR